MPRAARFWSLFLALCAFSAHASAPTLNCHGDLLYKDQKSRVRSSSPGVTLPKDASFRFTVLDTNQRELLKVWPWGSIQKKILLNPVESKQRHLRVDTNGLTWISVEIDSTSTKERNLLFCEMDGE